MNWVPWTASTEKGCDDAWSSWMMTTARCWRQLTTVAQWSLLTRGKGRRGQDDDASLRRGAMAVMSMVLRGA